MKGAFVTASGMFAVLALPVIMNCASSVPPMRAVRTPGVERIPLGIVLHPLFSTERANGGGRIVDDVGTSESFDRDRMYINPPAETTLKVTGLSERLTGLLSAELTARGFKLRDLPVQAPIEGENAFAVSLSLLDELRERHNVRAILIGNAFFASGYNASDAHVTDLYIKMVDVETLEVMCQITLPHDYSGWPIDEVAKEAASRLAVEAGLPVDSK